MKTWKLLLSLLLTSALSAFTAIGVFSYMNRNSGGQQPATDSAGFEQTGYRLASYAEAAENTDFTFAAEQSVNAVVHIKSIKQNTVQQTVDPFEWLFGNPFGGNSSPYRQQKQEPQVGFGSGVIISKDGYIVTNNHVIEGADEIEITTNDDRTFKAKLIGTDALTDIALLKIEGKDLHFLPFGNSDVLKVGQWVLAVGNPLNLTSTVTSGIISAIGRNDYVQGKDRRTGEIIERLSAYIQTDAAVNPGNSGGALVNTRGELIGINAALYSSNGSFIGYSFAIPINLVKKIVSDLKEFGIVQRAVLGIKVSDLSVMKEKETSEYEKLKVNEGVYVAELPEKSAAEKAGIKKGDVVTALNGSKIRNFGDLKAELARHRPGETVEVQIDRYGETKKFKVELKNEQGTTETFKYRSPADILGGTYKELSREAKMRLGLNYGIEVTEVKAGKLKEAGIKAGFIILTANDKRIESEETLLKTVETLLKETPDERGLFIKGIYPSTRKVEWIAIDLNE